MDNIIYYIKEYLGMKEHYKEFNKENLYDVFTIFANEVFELTDIVSEMDYKINILTDECILPNNPTKALMEEKEENLLNEIADVLLTSARLIKEFKLEEPLTEMLQYKYERQVGRELKRFKNELLK